LQVFDDAPDSLDLIIKIHVILGLAAFVSQADDCKNEE
jgi:hypothetical protein